MYSVIIRDMAGNFGKFDAKTVFGNKSNLHTKIAFTQNISHWTHNIWTDSFSHCNPGASITLSFHRVEKHDGQNGGNWCMTMLSWSVYCCHCSAETGEQVIASTIFIHTTLFGNKTFFLNFGGLSPLCYMSHWCKKDDSNSSWPADMWCEVSEIKNFLFLSFCIQNLTF